MSSYLARWLLLTLIACSATMASSQSLSRGPKPLPSHPGNIFLESEEVIVPLPGTAEQIWRLFNYEEKSVTEIRSRDGKARLGRLPLGFYRLRSTSDANADRVSVGVIAALETPTPSTSPIGLDVAMAWFYPPEKMEAAANLCALAGVNWVRDRLNWAEMEPEQGRFAEPNKYDASAAAQSRGALRVLQVNHISPGWANSNRKRLPLDLRDAYSFYREMAKRWQNQVLAYEPWNEADIPMFGGHTGAEMAAFQKASFLGLKAGHSNVIACLNVFALHKQAQLEDLHENQAWPYFDTFNFHHYQTFDRYPALYADFRAVSAGKPLWVTECSVPVKWAGDPKRKEPSDSDLREQAERVVKTFAASLHEGSAATFYFLLPHYVEGQTQFGLLRPDLTPRPAFLALAAVGRLLADAKPLGRINVTNGAVRAFLFHAQPDGQARSVLVAWATNAEASVELPMKPEAVFDHLGRGRPSGQTIKLSSAPMFALFSGNELPQFSLTAPPPPARRLVGDPSFIVLQALWPEDKTLLDKSAYRISQVEEIPIYAYNFWPRAVRGRLEVTAPKGWKAELPAEVELAPQERKELRLRVDSRSAASGGIEKLGIVGRFESAHEAILSVRLAPEPTKSSKGASSSASGKAQDTSANPLQVNHTRNSSTVPIYEVFELTFKNDQRYDNPFFDVRVDVTFTSPTGKKVQIGGFHYGSSAGPTIKTHTNQTSQGERKQVEYVFGQPDLWKARLAPFETGRWTYSYVFANAQNGRATGEGSFECVRGKVPARGFVRQHPTNPFRWVFDDGTPYFPIGLQECLGDGAGVGSALAVASMEGPFRMDRIGRPDPPAGPMFKPGPSSNPQNGDVYFRNYARAGFNLFRFSQKNCSFELYRDLDHYLVQEGVMTDELVRHSRKYGLRVFYGIFGYQPVFNNEATNAVAMAQVKRFIKYSVDRWGAFVDFWQFLNEQKASADWYDLMIPYLKSIDPYHHPITTSWERPELPGIEINAPHWYSGIGTALNCDQETATRAAAWKKFNKPVIVGEQGNHASKEQLQTPGIGGVWDADSSVRMRIRNWTAFFNEIAFVFWNTSYAKDGHYMNIWLGPQERQYIHAMQDFAYRLDNDVRMLPVPVSDAKAVRAYGLVSSARAAVYLHHFADHHHRVTNLTITLEAPRAAKGYWYAPENAAIIQQIEVPAGRQTLTVPNFVVDLALLITPDEPPDIDQDGQSNDSDTDDDNDGVPDGQDAFPLDPEEWADKDGDLIGDNMDADVDGDGIGDDRNKNGIPDCDEMDLDGDHVVKANAVPWDAFPLDPKESRDSDGDGLGDNADSDDDGDGWSDADETKSGTDPLDPLSFPLRYP